MKRMTIASLVLVAGGMLASVAQADDMTTDEARAAVTAFIKAVADGPAAVTTVLAPEFQILRSNGVAYDREGYINRGAGTVHAAPDFAVEDMVATAAGDVMVARYQLVIDETIEGKRVTKRAPRLTVFRKIEGQWMVTSHANFASVE